MLAAKKSVLFAFVVICAAYGGVSGDLDEIPSNTVAYVGDTITLRCSTVENLPTTLVMWMEFVTSDLGNVISNNRSVSPVHPNSARYAIVGTPLEYLLEISNVQLSDGGKYFCQDVSVGPPAVFRGYAELLVLNGDPECLGLDTLSGDLLEKQYYRTECSLTWRGNQTWAPVMTWTGPGLYTSGGFTTENLVWSGAAFNAQREQEDGEFIMRIGFVPLNGTNPPEYASNVPPYTYLFTTGSISIVWPPNPETMSITPVQSSYLVGDILTCNVDSKPAPSYTWTNIRTQEAVSFTSTYVIPPELDETNQTIRCNGHVLYEGLLYTADTFLNVPVGVVTTTPTPTTSRTTPPIPEGECADISGRWQSTNPRATLCIEVDIRGNLLVLVQNGTDLVFTLCNGLTVYGRYNHFSFGGSWPVPQGVAGFAGECHSCFGGETILLSGIRRNHYTDSDCGQSAGLDVTNLYVMTRTGPPCRGMELDIHNPDPIALQKMGIRAKNQS